MKHLIIIGCGGFAREVYWHAQNSHGFQYEWDIKGFIAGDIKDKPSELAKLNKPIVGDINTYSVDKDDVFICAIANAAARKRFTDTIREKGGCFINMIHNTALIQGNVKMGEGNIICPFTFVNDHATIGNHVILNMGAGLGHDSCIGDFSSMMGGACLCGFAHAGRNTYFATNAVALPSSKIDDDGYVGVGSVVFKHVRQGQKVFGNPALEI